MQQSRPSTAGCLSLTCSFCGAEFLRKRREVRSKSPCCSHKCSLQYRYKTLGIHVGFKAQTHCKNGHLLSEDNLRIRLNGSRQCRICYKKTKKEYRDTPEQKAQTRKCNRNRVYRTYGMTEESWNALLVSQNNCCALCGDPFKDVPGFRPHTDHDHVTNVVRGLLHGTCNTAIGLLADDPEKCRKAAAYIERNSCL